MKRETGIETRKAFKRLPVPRSVLFSIHIFSPKRKREEGEGRKEIVVEVMVVVGIRFSHLIVLFGKVELPRKKREATKNEVVTQARNQTSSINSQAVSK